MQTRAKQGYLMPRKLFNLTASTATSTLSPLPSSYRQALKDPNWRATMLNEFNALLRNDTWSLVSCPPGANVVTGKWIYRHKLNPDGTLSLSTKLVGWFAALLNKLAWIMGRLSVRL
jgi:hypothetical protein